MSGLGPLHFIGKVDRQEEMLMLNAQKEQAVMKTLLQGRDPATYNMLYGYRRFGTCTIPQPEALAVRTSCYHFTIARC